MRALALILLLCAAVPAAALAGTHDRADGTLVLKDAKGMVILSGSGSVLGQIDQGALTITDGNPGDANAPEVFGADRAPVQRSATTTTYKGKGLRFRFVGAQRYRIAIVGAGIDISAVGLGRVSLLGADAADDGQFSLDGGGYLAVPSTLFTGSFGQMTPLSG